MRIGDRSSDVCSSDLLTACRIELQSLKPGNVHVFADGHRMTVDDFEASAAASAPVIADPTLAVGERIYQAIQRTRAAVHSNTNLGIVQLGRASCRERVFQYV